MSDLVPVLEKAILEQNLVRPSETLLVGVSGGVDSVALLHLLHRISKKWPLGLVAAHFNHRLRGSSSDGDELFVRALAADLGLPCHVGAGDVRRLSSRHGISIEMAARQARHRFFARTAKAAGVSRLALAHHADDQVELFFLRVLRGAGWEGLGGMQWLSRSPVDPRLEIIRPLLGVCRGQIEAFAQEQELSFRHDASNDQLECERNRVRRELLPFIREKLSPSIHSSVPRLMEIIRDESDLVAQLTAKALEDRAEDFESLHPAIQRRWLRCKCWEAGVEAPFNLIEALRRQSGRRRMLDSKRSIWRDRAGEVHIAAVLQRHFRVEKAVVALDEPEGEECFGELTLNWRITPWSGHPDELPSKESGTERFDADCVGTPIRLRYWQPGDRFQPIGAGSPVKVQDLFTNLKIPAEERVRLTLAEAQSGQIFWIEGVRISERFKIGSSTRRCLEWRWTRAARGAGD